MATRSIGEYRKLAREPSDAVWKSTLPKIKKLLDVHFYEQGTSAWLAQRDTMLTASDVAAAIGTNPYQTSNSLFDKKTHHPKAPKFTGSAATRWGHKYEDEARKLYEKKTGEFVYEFGVISHPEHTWIGGSPDGVTASGRLLEIKVCCERKLHYRMAGLISSLKTLVFSGKKSF